MGCSRTQLPGWDQCFPSGKNLSSGCTKGLPDAPQKSWDHQGLNPDVLNFSPMSWLPNQYIPMIWEPQRCSSSITLPSDPPLGRWDPPKISAWEASGRSNQNLHKLIQPLRDGSCSSTVGRSSHFSFYPSKRLIRSTELRSGGKKGNSWCQHWGGKKEPPFPKSLQEKGRSE